MTTTPFMAIEARTGRIASTAAWSTRSLSPRPMKRPAAMAAASVTRTSSSARLRSGSLGRSRESAIVRVYARGALGRGARPSPSRWRSGLRVEPVEGPRDGLLPELVVLVALGGVHLRLPALVLGPVVADVVLAGPEAGGEARGVRGAQGGGLGHDRPDDRHAEEVGLELHEQVVLDHAAVDLERLEVDARVLVHRLDDLAALEGRGLQGRAGDVAGVDVARQAREHPAGVGLPVRREQAREGRHDVQPAVVLHGLRELLDLGRRLDHLEVVAQPLHERPGDRDRALQAVDGVVVADLVAQRREHAALGLHRLRARVEQEEVAGAIRVLGLARRQAGLTERGRLLVAQVAGDRDAREAAGLNLAVDLARGVDLGEHRGWHADGAGDLLVPREGLEVHQHRAAGVRDVGDVQPAVGATGEVPDEPGVHVAEGQVTRLGPIARAIDVVEDPADLRPREVGRQWQADLLLEAGLAAVARQLVDDLVRARVLPDERVVDRLAGVAVPHHRGLALVGDAQPGDVVGARPGRTQRLVEDLLATGPDLLGVVLDPTRLGIDLLVLLLRY